ncbi:sugar ABC transporter permease [Spirochaetota bacterium]|nr:sugar ABC transporter permease [Spirochaetota bacterium]
MKKDNDSVLYMHSPIIRIIIYGLLLLACLSFLFPLYVMIVTSFKTLEEIRKANMLALPENFTLMPWISAWQESCVGLRCKGLKDYFYNSIEIVVPGVVISTFLGACNGYVLTKWRFPGHNWVFGLLLFGCFIPFQAILIPAARTLGILAISNNPIGLILVHIAYGVGFTTLFFRNYYEVFPTELVQAATIEGAGFFQIFFKIMLPSSVPIIVVCFIWQFTNIWNDFIFGVSFTSGEGIPMTVALNNLANSSTGVKEYNVHMAAAIIAALPTLLLYILSGRYFVRGLMAGAVKG